MRDDFRANLLAALAAANVSRTRLAKITGVDKSVVSRWASGATRPAESNLAVLTESLRPILPQLRLSDWSLPTSRFHLLLQSKTDRQPDNGTPRPATTRLESELPILAVIPFRNLSRSPDNELFCDGVTDELITALARISGLRVIGRQSSFSAKLRSESDAESAENMGARFVISGQVQRFGDQARITVQLVDTDEQLTIWADRFDVHGSDYFAAQDEIVRNLCARIDTTIVLARNASRPVDELGGKVADKIRYAMALNYGADAKSYAAARKLLLPILAQNPDNPTALRTLAVADWHEAWLGLTDDPEAGFALGLKNAQRAIELDPTDEYAYWVCALGLLTARRYDEAVVHLHRALELSPNCSLAIGTMGTVLAWAGEFDESIDYNKLALKLDPQNPSIYFRHNGLGLAHYFKSDLTSAREWLQKSLSRRPTWIISNLLLAAVDAQAGRTSTALEAMQRALSVNPDVLSEHQLRFLLPFRNAEHLCRIRDDLETLRAVSP